jgi:Fe-S cluster assembly ATP-binding protein
MLEITDLHASVNGVEILKGVNLILKQGELSAIMGPNGSGKSTLAYVLAGHPGYKVNSGAITFDGKDLLALTPEERARMGLFLSFQHPIEIPGVRLDHFMRASFNAVRKSRGLEELGILEFDRLMNQKVQAVDMDRALTKRSLNVGFSGGEKKRNEVLQMTVLEPKLTILDEPDSGLDVDALRVIADGINKLRGPEKAMILITHYQRILDHVVPNAVHVLINGRIVRSGSKELAGEVEAKGYESLQTGIPSI